jgi:RimJ/RimL family protein N-acetyltransferase
VVVGLDDDMEILLRRLVAADLAEIEQWFAEGETGRWLGDRQWPRQLLRRAEGSPDRLALAAVWDGAVVGVLDVDPHDDQRAGVAYVVAPAQRRRGVATAMLTALISYPGLKEVVEYFAGVEQGNTASAALLTKAGFEQVRDTPDEAGFSYFAIRPDGSRPHRPWMVPS